MKKGFALALVKSNKTKPAGRPGVMDNTAIEKHLLKIISAEIEQRFDCKVIDISLCTIIGTPNVQVKIQYNEDFIYKPCENWTPDSICFSERSVRFFRKIDFFECVKNLGKHN